MAIVKMKHLRLLALRADREELLKKLQHLGCVEISEPEPEEDDPAWTALARPESGALGTARERRAKALEALEVLKKYAPEKGKGLSARPRITEGELFDDAAYDRAAETAQTICAAEREDVYKRQILDYYFSAKDTMDAAPVENTLTR